MAKVEVKNLKKVFKNVKKLFDAGIANAQLIEEIKDYSVLRIQAETRKGKDLKNERQQPDLSKGSLRLREQIRSGKIVLSYPQDERFFKVSKSNLTLTGQLLDSIKGKVNIKKGVVGFGKKSMIETFVSGSRSPVKYIYSKTGKEIKELGKNQIRDNGDLAKSLAKRGREFLGMDKKGIKFIRKKVLDEIRRLIRGKG